MLLSSGANYGFRKSVPHMLGISVGHSFMVFLVGIGLMGLFEAVPLAHDLLTLAEVAQYLRVSTRTVSRMIKSDRLPAKRQAGEDAKFPSGRSVEGTHP